MVASITLAEGEPTEPKHGDVNDTAGGSPDLADWAADNVTTGTFGSVTVAASHRASVLVPVPVGTSNNFTVEVPPVANLTGRKPLDGGLTTQMLDSTNATVAPPRVIIGVVSTRTATANSTVPLILPASPESGSGVHMAVAIVPVLITFSIILVLLIVFLSRKRRSRVLSSKGRAGRDEENSMEVTSMLMNHDHGDDDDTHATAVYAIVNKTKKAKKNNTSTASIWAPSVTGSAADRNSSAMTSAESGNLITNIPDIDIPMITLLTPNGEQHLLLLDNVHSTQQEQKPRCDMPVRKEGEEEEEEEEKKEEEGKRGAIQPEPVVRVTDSVIVDPTVRTSVEPRGLVELGVPKPGVAVADADMTLVECDVYEPAGRYDANRDDEDGAYEIPDSPATVRARNSVVGLGALLQSRDHHAGGSPASTAGGVTVATDIAMPQRFGADTSDSDSEHESDFEDLWRNHTYRDSNGGKADDSPNNRTAPPVPKLLPLDDLDTEYLFPKCHKHCPPGPDWKPFHEYDPVYVPHSDPAGMADRLDNQNYVRGRQRTDSRQTNAYEEIQFGGQIYDTVDDDDVGDNDDGVNNNSNNRSQNGHPRNPLQLPPRAPRPPSPPPPLVPRRTRPISGFADIGHRASTINKPLPPKPESERESCYSGLIMDDVSDPEDGPNHEYTALAYTKLRSVGSGPLLDGQDDDFRAIDETDSETYAKQPLKAAVSSPHLTPRTTSDTSNVDGDVSSKPATENTDSSNKTSVLFFNGNSEIFSNGHMVAQDESDSTDSDDSYEPFDFDILPPDATKKTTEKHQ